MKRCPSRLSLRLVLSHMAVAVVCVAVAYVVVRLLAPQLFDEATRGLGGGYGWGRGQGRGLGMREVVAEAIDAALLLGLLLSTVVAGVLAWISCRHLLRPLGAVRETTRRIAAGDYADRVQLPRPAELAGLADDVNRLAATLERSEERRLQLIADVTHELRTPLTIADGFVEGMRDGVFDADETRLAAVAAELDRMRRLTDDLSTLSRTEEGRIELRPTTVAVQQIAELVVDRLAIQATERDIALRLAPASEPATAHADPERVAQILTNLVRNALQATASGGCVEICCIAEPRGATVRVCDTGRGLDAAELDAIFERFHRLAGPGGYRGSGIGLPVARGLARAMGGDVRAESPGRGRGATFTLTLPG